MAKLPYRLNEGQSESERARALQQNFEAVETQYSTKDEVNNLAGAWKPLMQAEGYYGAGTGALRYWIPTDGQGCLGSGSAGWNRVPAIYLDPALYAVSGRVTKLRVRGYTAANSSASGGSFTIGLTLVGTLSGTAGAIGGTHSTSYENAAATPHPVAGGSATSVYVFDFPSVVGLYGLTVAITATTAPNSLIAVGARLEISYV